MVRRAKCGVPRQWVRRSGRLCRRNSVDDAPVGYQNTSSNLREKTLREPRSCTCILDLPEECLVIVFKSLTAYEICNASTVCKRFYHVSRNSALWRSVYLSLEDFSRLHAQRVSFVDLDNYDWRETNIDTKRRMLFASFLSARKAALTEIRFHGNFNIYLEADMLLCLLSKCNVKNLKKVDMKPYGIYWCWELGVQVVLKRLVQKCRNSLKFLRCFVDVSYTTAKLIGSLHNLEYLQLNFRNAKPSHDILQPEAMDAILSRLPNLKHLKITTRQYIYDKDTFPGYVLKSDTLETLDFGFTKEFLITGMVLPKLRTIKAEFPYIGYFTERITCLFDIVEKGCPLIQTINGYTAPIPGLQNFQLSETEKRELYFCSCSAHSPSRNEH